MREKKKGITVNREDGKDEFSVSFCFESFVIMLIFTQDKISDCKRCVTPHISAQY